MIGERINNYQIVSVLGEGGMGSVFLAEHPFMGRKAAIKVLRKELAEDRGLVERFMNEARAANAIRHPNIIDIIDVGLLPSGIPYLMMEFLEGESLAARIERQCPMPIAEAVEVAAQTASALAAAHDKGIVHRDLKPDNLFVIPDRGNAVGRIKVLDFGIAKLRGELSGNSARTRAGAIMGTPPYMSPEQCRGVEEVDHRTDIYALGIILYEMLTGSPPFVSAGWGEVVHMHISQAPKPLRPENPAVSPEMEALVLKALAKQPDARWRSMTELEGALRGVPGQSAATTPKVPRYSPTAPTTLRSATGQVATSPETPTAVDGPSGRSRILRAALVLGGVGAGIAVAAVGLVSRRPPEGNGAASATSPAAPVAAAAAAPAPAAPTAPEPAAAAPTPAPVAAAPAPPPPETAREVEVRAAPVGTSRGAAPASPSAKKKGAVAKAAHRALASEAPAAPTSPPAAASAAAAPAKKPDCNPNYYFDAQARKHFKPECF